MLRILLSILLLNAGLALGFPEMVRHGYGNCMTCHHSPTGGGLLTEYGRSLSKEALSWKGGDTEGDFLYGLVRPPKPLVFGGDVRLLQNIQNLNHRTTLKFIPMQADLETGLDLAPFALVGTTGVDYDGKFISRRHYALYRPLDKLTIRAGRFLPAYGLNTENHFIGVKRGLGRDQATETYNLEVSWIAETWDAYLTGIFGRIDSPTLGAESGLALSSSLFINKRFKLGLSYYYGSRDIETRHLAGPFAALSITKSLVVLFEGDFQALTPRIANRRTRPGFVDNLRIDYELFQGMHLYLSQEYSALDTGSASSVGGQGYGVGAQFFPRPHLEFNLFYRKLQYAGNHTFGDYGFLLFHYYL